MPNTAFNNLVALMNAVFVETARPDMINETGQAVFSSTLKMHGMEFFRKDVVPAQLVFPSASYIQQIDTGALPLYRSISYIRKDDPSLYGSYELNPNNNLPPLFTNIDGSVISMGQARKLLREIDPDDFLDEYGAEKVDVWYQAGSTIAVKSSTSLQWGLIGFYAWPNLDIGNANLLTFTTLPGNCSPLFNSWIAAEYPYAIIYDAASAILQKTGMTDAARKYDQVPDRNGKGAGLVWSHIDNLLMNNIKATGS